MCDGTKITMTTMSKTKGNKDAVENIEGDATTTEEATETTEETTEEVEAAEVTEETEEEGAAGDKDLDKDKDIDYDKELEDEKKRGKPDPAIASEAFKGRKQKRAAEADEEEQEADDDKPLTRKDIAAIEARVERRALSGQALSIAQRLAGKHANSDKEAQLIVARWSNRTFPEGTPLSEQLEEVYVGLPHVRRRLIGERNEALRALAAKPGAGKNGAGAHREATSALEPKLAPQNAKAIKDAGFKWNGDMRRYEKKLSNGGIVIRDSKTGQTQLIQPKK